MDNVDTFYGLSEYLRAILVYFSVIGKCSILVYFWHILRSFGICSSRFGMLHQEKSGNLCLPMYLRKKYIFYFPSPVAANRWTL
jgi:hypothetical protein